MYPTVLTSISEMLGVPEVMLRVFMGVVTSWGVVGLQHIILPLSRPLGRPHSAASGGLETSTGHLTSGGLENSTRKRAGGVLVNSALF